MKRILIICLAAALLANAGMARPAMAAAVEAGEAYIYPTFSELTQAAVILGGFDLNDPKVLREYIRLMYCDLYKANYRDDFAWNKVEKQIRTRINTKKEYYRTLYQIGGSVMLGPYDFKEQRFPLVDNTDFKNVGYMALFSGVDFKPYCDIEDPDTHQLVSHAFDFPVNVNIALSEPLNLTAIKVSQAQAQKILAIMSKLGTVSTRKLYVRFRFRVQSVAPVDTSIGPTGKTDFNGEIVGIDLFYDKEMTKWIMTLPVNG